MITAAAKKQGPRVLVTGTGGPSGISVMNALGAEALDIFSADVDPYAAGLYLVDEDRRLIIPRGEADSYAAFVLELCERLEIAVLIPTVDSELIPLAGERRAFAAAGTELVLASEQTLRICLDKWALHRRCQGAVRVPRSLLVDAAFDPSLPELPVIVKPRVGSGSRGIRLVEHRDELERLDRRPGALRREGDRSGASRPAQSRLGNRGHRPHGPRRGPAGDRPRSGRTDRPHLGGQRPGEGSR
jgi:carbamoyl-phosphate synthase large subunit